MELRHAWLHWPPPNHLTMGNAAMLRTILALPTKPVFVSAHRMLRQMRRTFGERWKVREVMACVDKRLVLQTGILDKSMMTVSTLLATAKSAQPRRMPAIT